MACSVNIPNIMKITTLLMKLSKDQNYPLCLTVIQILWAIQVLFTNQHFYVVLKAENTAKPQLSMHMGLTHDNN